LIIRGLLKTSTADYPSKISAVVFTQGCNFHCPYCHNPRLVGPGVETLDQAEVLAFLKKRRGVLDGVVVSGGEPTIHNDLPGFVARVKDLGYPVKLDTNGSNPGVLALMLDRGLLDYVALDLKADPGGYPEVMADPRLSANVPLSLKILQDGLVPAEFRTTCAAPFIDERSIKCIAEAAAGDKTLYLQQYRPESVLNPGFMGLHPDQPEEGDLEKFRRIAESHLPCRIRNYQRTPGD
jgi:pyruvate formate lyase activating enzyme